MATLAIPIWEFVLRGAVVYIFLLVLLRLTGKRQIGQLATFDLVLLLVRIDQRCARGLSGEQRIHHRPAEALQRLRSDHQC